VGPLYLSLAPVAQTSSYATVEKIIMDV